MKKAFTLLILLLPAAASAAEFNLSPLQKLISALGNLIGALIPILITAALVVFFWGLVRYLWGAASKPNHEKGKKLMLWGVVTLFVMVSVWGIVDLMQRTLDINKNATGKAPQIQYNSSGPLYGSGGYTP